MRRRHNSYFAILMIVLTLTLSFVYTSIVVSQDSVEIISALEELQDDVSGLPDNAFENTHSTKGHRTALTNKIHAVIHQIKAGASEGALNKLENDIKGTVGLWVTAEYESDLIEKIDEIINLIKGECPPHKDTAPPNIESVLRIPETPNYDEDVTVKAQVEDEESGVDLVILSYSPNTVDWINVTMNFEEEPIYEGSIPSLLFGTMVQYMVYASDKAGNWAVSGIYSYIVGDKYPPTVRIDNPTQGSYVEGVVEITIFVYDDNFEMAELSINGVIVASWSSTGEHSYNWDTTTYIDGVNILNLTAYDEAGNFAERQLTVTVDNRPPTARINAPTQGAFLKGVVIVNVTGADDNFEKMQLYIDTALVQTLYASGTHTYVWDTSSSLDGIYTIALEVYDKADVTATCEITVTVDNTLPTAEIREPQQDAYVEDTVNVVVYGNDTNLLQTKLYIDNNLIEDWTTSGEQTYIWDTSGLPDGSYMITSIVSDEAGNIDEKAIEVIVDNTGPTAFIHAPIEGSFLRDTLLIDVTGDDANFDRMELKIGVVLAKTWTTSGDKLFSWNTKAYSNGAYKVALTVFDKANSSKEVFVTVIVDNTPPLIEAAAWTPKEPFTGEYVNVTAKVSDPHQGSGIQSVILWFRNTVMDDWQLILMSLNVTSWNWTATIPAQSIETTIEFYVEAFDNAGNKAVSVERYEYGVVAPAGIPLAWIVAIILLILAATVAAIYFWGKRRREKQSIDRGRVENYKLTILMCL